MTCEDRKVYETVGTVVKLNISIRPIGTVSFSQMDFTGNFFTHEDRVLTMTKDQFIKVDDDNYVAIIDTSKIGGGNIMCRLEVKVPDTEMANNERLEIVTFKTGIRIHEV